MRIKSFALPARQAPKSSYKWSSAITPTSRGYNLGVSCFYSPGHPKNEPWLVGGYVGDEILPSHDYNQP